MARGRGRGRASYQDSWLDRAPLPVSEALFPEAPERVPDSRSLESRVRNQDPNPQETDLTQEQVKDQGQRAG